MSDFFNLKILSAEKELFQGEVVSLIFPMEDGDYQVLAHHESQIVAIRDGQLRYRCEEGAEPRAVVIGMGFVHIANNKVTVIVDTAEYPEDVEAARAAREKARNEEQFRQDKSIQEYKISQMAMAKAMLRLTSDDEHRYR